MRRKLQLLPPSAPSASSRFAIQSADFVLRRYISSLHVPFFLASLHEVSYAYTRKTVVDSSLKLWSLAGSTRADTNNPLFQYAEGGLSRLCRCGSGFFRAVAFQSASLLSIELHALCQDESISETSIRPELVNVVEDAADWYLNCIRAGETGIKGYMLLTILSAQIDAIKRNVSKEDMPPILIRAFENAEKRCLPLLEDLAECGQANGGADPFLQVGIQQTSELLEDWDTLMADGPGESFDAFLT